MRAVPKILELIAPYKTSASALFPKRVKLVEVGPRDGLQDEKITVRTDPKI
jgi:hypothetical protein